MAAVAELQGADPDREAVLVNVYQVWIRVCACIQPDGSWIAYVIHPHMFPTVFSGEMEGMLLAPHSGRSPTPINSSPLSKHMHTRTRTQNGPDPYFAEMFPAPKRSLQETDTFTRTHHLQVG